MLGMNIQIFREMGSKKCISCEMGLRNFSVLRDELNKLPVNWEWGLFFVICLILSNSPTMPTLHTHAHMMPNIAI